MMLPQSVRKEIEAVRWLSILDAIRIAELAYREGVMWEREACAKVCEELRLSWLKGNAEHFISDFDACAAAIRAMKLPLRFWPISLAALIDGFDHTEPTE